MDARETAEVLAYLSAAYPRTDLHEETVLVWIDQFGNADYELAVRVAKRIVASDEWFPTVARFREVLGIELRRSSVSRECGDCENGFIVMANGDVTFCRVCRPDAPQEALGPSAAAMRSADWRRWVDQSRKELDKPFN
jgi:hypothetical protein